jgi:hypothetical protein
MTARSGILVCLVGAAMLCAGPAHAASASAPGAKTPAPLVDTYQSLADAILATKETEWNLVNTILATTYQHAEGVYSKAVALVQAGDSAKSEIEMLADLVSQLGNEGDASIAAIRKKLLEGGHHHHHHSAKGEDQDEFDEGFVIVNRDARQVFLAAAGAIGKMASKPDAGALGDQWDKVEQQYNQLMHEAK